jgi:hypothetical protein
MSEDKHFNEGDQPVPHALEDHKPSDAPAARSIGIVIAVALVVCGIILAIIYTNTSKAGDQDVGPAENAAPK